MTKSQVRDVMVQMEREPPGSSVILPLETKSERDSARIMFTRYAEDISAKQYPLYKYCFNFHTTCRSRDSVDGFAIDRVALNSHQRAILRVKGPGISERELDVITDPNLVSLVEKQKDLDLTLFLRRHPYDEVLDPNAPEDIKRRFKDGYLTQQESEKYVTYIDWTEEKIKEIEARILKDLWEGNNFLDYAQVDKERTENIMRKMKGGDRDE